MVVEVKRVRDTKRNAFCISIKNTHTIELPTMCVYIFWATLMVGKGFGLTNQDYEFRYMTMAVLVLVFIKIVTSRWSREKLIRSICLGLIGIAVWIRSEETDILLTMVIIISCKGIDIYKLFRISVYIRAVLFFVRTSLAILNFADMQPMRYTRDETGVRYALGYVHPNTTQYELFVIIALILIIWHDRMKLWHFLLVCGYNLFIFQYTGSRTGAFLTCLVLLLTYLANRSPVNMTRKIIAYFGEYAYIIGATVSFLMCLLLDRIPLLQSLGTFSSRFFTGRWVMRHMNLSLFGIPGAATDLGMISILYGHGMIVFGFFIITMTLLLKKFHRQEQYTEEIIGIAYALYNMMESSSLSCLMNVMWLFLS